jgi:hypothetical protein
VKPFRQLYSQKEAECFRHSPLYGFRLEAKFKSARLLLTKHLGTYDHEQDCRQHESRKLQFVSHATSVVSLAIMPQARLTP